MICRQRNSIANTDSNPRQQVRGVGGYVAGRIGHGKSSDSLASAWVDTVTSKIKFTGKSICSGFSLHNYITAWRSRDNKPKLPLHMGERTDNPVAARVSNPSTRRNRIWKIVIALQVLGQFSHQYPRQAPPVMLFYPALRDTMLRCAALSLSICGNMERTTLLQGLTA